MPCRNGCARAVPVTYTYGDSYGHTQFDANSYGVANRYSDPDGNTNFDTHALRQWGNTKRRIREWQLPTLGSP
jgi:hypothetical protein